MPRLILIGGGSSSGKTYITESIIKALGEDKITYITLDDYYKDQSTMSMEERMKVNYDHPKAFDWPLMRKQIADLKAGKAIEKPTYDFTILTRSNKTETDRPERPHHRRRHHGPRRQRPPFLERPPRLHLRER
jgi:uridine kinase